MFNRIVYGFTALLLLCSCEHSSGEYKSTDRRDQFVGTYRVVNTNPQYEYEISKLDSNGQAWMRVKNFANLFDMKYRFEDITIPNNILNFEAYDAGDPIRDKYNNRWTFAVYHNPSIPDNALLHQDTLKVYFRIQNALWWFDDDTVAIDKYYLHTAVKIK